MSLLWEGQGLTGKLTRDKAYGNLVCATSVYRLGQCYLCKLQSELWVRVAY